MMRRRRMRTIMKRVMKKKMMMMMMTRRMMMRMMKRGIRWGYVGSTMINPCEHMTDRTRVESIPQNQFCLESQPLILLKSAKARGTQAGATQLSWSGSTRFCSEILHAPPPAAGRHM